MIAVLQVSISGKETSGDGIRDLGKSKGCKKIKTVLEDVQLSVFAKIIEINCIFVPDAFGR